MEDGQDTEACLDWMVKMLVMVFGTISEIENKKKLIKICVTCGDLIRTFRSI